MDKKEFKTLSNEERSEEYAKIKDRSEIYQNPNFSIQKKIHFKRYQNLRKFMGNVSDKKVLDAGAGEGFFLSSFSCEKKIGLELSKERIKRSKKLFPNLKIKHGDVRELPFEDESLDVIICSEVLEHVEGYEKGISELKRCLKKNGHLILSFPNEFMVNIGRLILLKFPIHELDHVNSIKPKNIKKLLGEKYQTAHVPALPYPFCLYQVYKFNGEDIK